MSANSKIEWTDATWNPLRARRRDTGKVGWHCEKISPACDHCYAASMNKRSDGLVGIGTGLNYAADSRAKVEAFVDEKTLLQPLKWRKPRKIFVCSMTDLFGEWHTDEMIDRIFAVMALCPQHTFQVLSKRPQRMMDYIGWPYRSRMVEVIGVGTGGVRSASWMTPLDNVWLGVTAENQEQADARIPLLLKTPAAKRFVSAEPLLGTVDLSCVPWPKDWKAPTDDYSDGFDALRFSDKNSAHRLACLDWVIAGGESGPGARPSHPDWFRSLRDQCQTAGVAFYFKQWGAWQNGSDEKWRGDVVLNDGRHVKSSNEVDQDTRNHWSELRPTMMARVGKKSSGRLLDGVEWSQFPGGAA